MSDPGHASILVVDDEPDILESLQDLFNAELPEVKVHTALSGQDALDMMAEHTFDLVISDYKMPGMDGLQFLNRVRQTAPQIPRVLMTAFPDLTIAIDAINEASVENFFVKPLEPDDIIEQIRAMLAARAAQSQRRRAFARALEMQRQPKAAAEVKEEEADE